MMTAASYDLLPTSTNAIARNLYLSSPKLIQVRTLTPLWPLYNKCAADKPSFAASSADPVLYASATFDIPITAVAEGSQARASFEADFKEGVVASMASGGITISESNIEIVAISAGSIMALSALSSSSTVRQLSLQSVVAQLACLGGRCGALVC